MKTVLITGGSSGIGHATAIALKEKGYMVYATGRTAASVKPLEEKGIRTLVLDITDDASIQAAIARVESEVNTIDVLINNAGYGSYGSVEDVPMSEAREQFEVNVFGLARLTQLVIPKMREARRGTIINIASVAGRMGGAFGAWYHASKYAVEGFNDSLALELKPFGIKVIAVEPGAIKTQWSKIAATNLIKVSGNTAYAEGAKKKANALNSFNDLSMASSPEVIAHKIVQILDKKNPAFRYAVGGGAKPMLFLRWITSDKLFYWLFRKII